MNRYKRFTIRRLHSPRLFIGLWPIGICLWRNFAVTGQWHGWKHKYRVD